MLHSEDSEGSLQGSIGLILSHLAPFQVEAVYALMDEHGVLQGQQGYVNDLIEVHNQLVAVNGYNVAELERTSAFNLGRFLQGPCTSCVDLIFIKATSGKQVSIRVRRQQLGGAFKSTGTGSRIRIEGQVRGISVLIGRLNIHHNNHPVFVVHVSRRGSAEQSIQEGDQLLAVGDLECLGQPLSTISNRIAGPSGTRITLRLKKVLYNIYHSCHFARALHKGSVGRAAALALLVAARPVRRFSAPFGYLRVIGGGRGCLLV